MESTFGGWNTLGPGLFSLGITCDGNMWGWGNGGALGNADATVCQPTLVCCGIKWKYVHASTGGSSYGIDTAGNGYAWGSNSCGVLGIGSVTTASLPTPICCNLKWKMFAGTGPTSNSFAIGITCSGDMYAFGNNTNGQFGNGSGGNCACQPTLVCCGIKWKTGAVGPNGTTYGIDFQGNLYAWGVATQGALGNNTTTSTCLPTLVCCAFKWKAIAAACNFAVGITAEGVMYAWGANSCGQIGNNTITQTCQPTQTCCGFSWGPLYNQNYRVYPVVPGATYGVSVFGRKQTFEYDPVSSDYATEAIILEYWQ